MPTRQTIISEVERLVGGAKNTRGVPTIADCLETALRDLNRHSPRKATTTLTGDGTDEYALGSLWSVGFSTISRIRYLPDGDYNEASIFLTPEEWDSTEQTSAGAAQIRFNFSPDSNAKLLIEHTARHTLTDAAATTTPNDDEAGALAHRAAAVLLRSAAATAAGLAPQATDEDFALSAIGGLSGEYRRLADDYDAAFDQLLGIDRSGRSGAARGSPVVVTVPSQPNKRNMGYLTHPRKRVW